VSRANDRLDVSPRRKVTDDFHFPRIEQLHEIVENAVRDVLVIDPLVAKLIDVELEAFQFHTTVFRNVFDED